VSKEVGGGTYLISSLVGYWLSGCCFADFPRRLQIQVYSAWI